MKTGKKELLMGAIFSLFIALFINYNSIERLVEMVRGGGDGDPSRVLIPLIFSVVWFFAISMIYYLLYVVICNLFHNKNHNATMVLSIFVTSIVVTYLLITIYPWARDVAIPEFVTRRPPSAPAPSSTRMMNVSRGLSSAQFMHILVAIMNLLFFCIQRLLYRNQEIEMRNEQLQLESVRSQHSALIQQINPHFFFNSLGSLRYIIQKGDGEDAVCFLDNLTAIFRKTLKLSGDTLHTVGEEVELTHSYMHIIEQRFAGKIFVDFAVAENFEHYKLSPLSILTLMENVIKHNTVSIKRPVQIKVYTTPAEELVVENNIVPKFDEVESNGIGLINLNKQYLLLTGKGVVVTTDNDIFRVVLPLIKGE